MSKIKMNKRAEENYDDSLLMSNVVYILLLFIFTAGIIYFVFDQKQGAGVWGEFYAQEIAKLIDLSEPGEEVIIDVQLATEIAKRNKVASSSEIFSIDNLDNEVCVKLSPTRKNCVSYFQDVDVVNLELELGQPENLLSFKIKEPKLTEQSTPNEIKERENEKR